MKQYKVGDVVWWAMIERYKQVTKPCPICFGNKEVTLILGNKEQVILPCNYCRSGYDDPSGTIIEHEWHGVPKQITIDGMEVQINSLGEKREYHSGSPTSHYILTDDDIFDTEEEALKKCEAIKQKVENEERTRAEYIKKDKVKSFSWNAGYHLREATRLEKDAARHREQAKLCKERAKV